MRRRRQLAAEVAALEADDEDRSEMLAVASLMQMWSVDNALVVVLGRD